MWPSLLKYILITIWQNKIHMFDTFNFKFKCLVHMIIFQQQYAGLSNEECVEKTYIRYQDAIFV